MGKENRIFREIDFLRSNPEIGKMKDNERKAREKIIIYFSYKI